MIRSERHRLRKSSPFYQKLHEFCYLAKNLYNHGNYVIRQEFIKNKRWIRYNELDSLLKNDKNYPDYRSMPVAQSAQQTLRLLDKNWLSFFNAIKDWRQYPEKYPKRPYLPGYKRKNSCFVLILTNQNCKIKNGILRFPRTFDGFTIKPMFIKNEEAVFKQVRLIPKPDSIMLEIIYELPDVEEFEDNGKYASIDIGVNNLAALVMNTGKCSFLIRGRVLKSINQYYNKKLARMRRICKLMNGNYSSKRITRLIEKRNRKIEDYLHKASSKIITLCRENGISRLIIGKNKNWKQNINLGKIGNQLFAQIPFAKFIQMLQYKALNIDLKVILTEESYTSGTSFLDDEEPIKRFYNKKRRIYRGLFITNKGKSINADINGAFQIMKKVFPNVKADGIEGVALCPSVVNLSMIV